MKKKAISRYRRLLQRFITPWLLLAVLKGVCGTAAAQTASAPSPNPSTPDAGFVPVPSIIRDLNSPAENLRNITSELTRLENELRTPHPVLNDLLKVRSELKANPSDRRCRARYERKFAEAIGVLHERTRKYLDREDDMLKAIQQISEETRSRNEKVAEQLAGHDAQHVKSVKQIEQHRNSLKELKKSKSATGLSDDEISDAHTTRSDLDTEIAIGHLSEGTMKTILERKNKLEEIQRFTQLNANLMRVRFRSAHNDQRILESLARLRQERAENQVTDAELQSVLTSLEFPATHGLPAQLGQLQNLVDDALGEIPEPAAPVSSTLDIMQQEYRKVDTLFEGLDTP